MFDVYEKRVSQKLRIRKNYLFDKNESNFIHIPNNNK
jgi:hypothetical protein